MKINFLKFSVNYSVNLYVPERKLVTNPYFLTLRITKLSKSTGADNFDNLITQIVQINTSSELKCIEKAKHMSVKNFIKYWSKFSYFVMLYDLYKPH